MRRTFAASLGLAAGLVFSPIPALFGSDYVRTLSGDFSTTDWYKVDPNPTECNQICCNGMCGPPGAGDNVSLGSMDVTASGGSVMTLSGGFSATSATAFTLKGSGTLTPKSSFSLNVNGGYLSAKTDVGKTILVPNSGSETFAGVARRPK